MASYTIQYGNTLGGIAASNHTTVAAIQAANPSITNANKIYAGSTINIPGQSSSGGGGGGSPVPAPAPAPQAAPAPTTNTSGGFSGGSAGGTVFNPSPGQVGAGNGITSTSGPIQNTINNTKQTVTSLLGDYSDPTGFAATQIAYNKQLQAQIDALEARRTSEQSNISNMYGVQQTQLQDTQAHQTGQESTALAAMGGYLGPSAGGIGALNTLARSHQEDMNALMANRSNAVQQANNAIDNKQYELATTQAAAAKQYEADVYNRQQQYVQTKLNIQSSNNANQTAQNTNDINKASAVAPALAQTLQNLPPGIDPNAIITAYAQQVGITNPTVLAGAIAQYSQQQKNTIFSTATSLGAQYGVAPDLTHLTMNNFGDFINKITQSPNFKIQESKNASDLYTFLQNNGLPVPQSITSLVGNIGDIGGSPNQNGYSGPTNGKGVVAGYDISNYAENPTNVQQVQSIYNSIPPTATSTPAALTSYIKQVAPNSPLTGDMIMATSSKYGVDPQVMTAIMQNESNFGTLGLATKTFNPANVGNTSPSNTKNQGSWQTGVDALGQNLSGRKVGGTNSSTLPTGTVQNANVLPQNSTLPPIIRSNITNPPINGVNYISSADVPGASLDTVKRLGGYNGVKVLDPGDVQTVKDMSNVLDYIGTMKANTDKLLSSGLWGKLKDETWNRGGAMAGINPDYKDFETARNNAIGIVQSLRAGGNAPLKQGVIDQAMSWIPQITDTKETAQRGLDNLQKFIDTQMKSILPNAKDSVFVANKHYYVGQIVPTKSGSIKINADGGADPVQ